MSLLFCATADSPAQVDSRSHGPHIGSGTEPAHDKSMGKEDILRYISSLKKASNLAIFLPKIRIRTSAYNISEKAQKGRGR